MIQITSLDILLENYWILKDQDSEKYENIRSGLTEEEIQFIKHKLGYKLIINPYLVKLEKIPGIPNEFMGILEFQSKLDYLFLCMILIFLEGKSPKEQFILSNLIEFVENSSVDMDLADIAIDFTLFKHRQAMVRVLRYIRNLGFIKLYDGDENKFAENIENDVLYEITGVSKYFVRNFTSNILDCNGYKDIYEQEQLGLEQNRGLERTQRVYRRIFMENVVYKEDVEDSDYEYIKKYKNVISRDCDILFDSSFEVHKNGAYMVLSEEKAYKNVFPSNKAISDVVLFLNSKLKQMLENNDFEISLSDTITVSTYMWQNIIEAVRNEFGRGFSKEYRTLEIEKLVYEVTNYMKQFGMIREDKDNNGYIVMPITFKLGGHYSDEFLNYINKKE